MTYPPPWYTPNKGAPRQNLNVARGLHPMGMPFADNGATCGDCEHLERHSMGSTWLKCAKSRQTSSRATDVRAKWPACSLFTPPDEVGR